MPGLGGGSGKPKPFVKASITISENIGTQKRWVLVDAPAVQEGDIVRGFGLVVGRKWFVTKAGGMLKFQNGKVESYGWNDQVIAFTEAEGEPVG